VSADCDRPTAAIATIIGENERHGVALGPLSSLGRTVCFAEPHSLLSFGRRSAWRHSTESDA
jgi:hypothetical protein